MEKTFEEITQEDLRHVTLRDPDEAAAEAFRIACDKPAVTIRIEGQDASALPSADNLRKIWFGLAVILLMMVPSTAFPTTDGSGKDGYGKETLVKKPPVSRHYDNRGNPCMHKDCLLSNELPTQVDDGKVKDPSRAR